MAKGLFSGQTVGLWLDDIGHRIQRNKQNGAEVKLVDLTLTLNPLSAELASALDEDVRGVLFRRTTAEVVPYLASAAFKIGVPKQTMEVSHAPDARPSIAFTPVTIERVRARMDKGADAWVLVLHAVMGPVGREDLEFVNDWYTGQRFVSFAELAPQFDFDEVGQERRDAVASL